METSIVMAVTGIVVGFMQAVIIFMLAGIKKDQADIWERINNHRHEVTCTGQDCRQLKTGDVIIPGG
ncbi:MAG: hypothetical protein LLG93_12320 [Deltaproteobacteria bacterium]|jgi:hypothetical protein|nr:hypothetical protein [Deltaproteobacteria bacterium]